MSETSDPVPSTPSVPRWQQQLSRLVPISRGAVGFLPLVLTLIAFYKCASFSVEYGVNAPCSDNWAFVELHEKFKDGTLRFDDLFAMHNEHLLFLPRILFALLGWATNHNLHAQALLSLPELFLSLIAILLAAARAGGFHWYKPPWWFVPVPFLLFTLSQSRNLLCSFHRPGVTQALSARITESPPLVSECVAPLRDTNCVCAQRSRALELRFGVDHPA